MGTVECLSFSGKDDEVIGDILRNETNTPIMLWVDRERDENIICVMYLTGMGNIRDVIPFPRTPRNADF